MKGTAGCLVLAVVGLGGIGCGNGALPAGEVTLPDALTCAQTPWTVVSLIAKGNSVPSDLVLRDGTFYLSVESMGIIALPAAGGDPVVLTTELASRLWVEGDWIYFGQVDDKLRRLPLEGGTPTVVLDGMTSYVAPGYGFPGETALDTSHYYWDLSPQLGPETYALWRAPRAGGGAEKLVELPPKAPAYSWPQLTLTPDTAILALNTQNVAYVVPLAGGSMRMLPPPPVAPHGTSNMLVGSSPTGVLWKNERWTTGEPYPTTHMSFSDVADSSATTARPFWSSKPPFMRPGSRSAWSDGAGGWIVAGSETFADRSAHTALWAVDGAGTTGTRLGCNPDAGFVSVWSTVSTPEAVYAVVNQEDPTTLSYQWLLVRIDRLPPAPTGA
jgi:hypothetical protein